MGKMKKLRSVSLNQDSILPRQIKFNVAVFINQIEIPTVQSLNWKINVPVAFSPSLENIQFKLIGSQITFKSEVTLSSFTFSLKSCVYLTPLMPRRS